MSEEALQIAEKRREAKGKGEKERYTLNIFDISRDISECRVPEKSKERKEKLFKLTMK